MGNLTFTYPTPDTVRAVTILEEKPALDTTEGGPSRRAWLCDNVVWDRHSKRAKRCGKRLMDVHLEPGSSVEVVCPKCGKKSQLSAQ